MADTSISQLVETALTSGGFIEISIPDGGGGWLSKKISHPNYLATLNTYVAQATTTVKSKGKSAAFTIVLNADTKLESIDFVWVSGTSVAVKVGTTVAGTQVVSGRTLTSIKNSFNILQDYFAGSTTLYFTITGGAVDIITNYRNNYNS